MTRGKVVQINISNGGLPKLGIKQATIGALGVEGDRHNHPEIHGGPRKALLLICKEVLDALVAEGYPVEPGSLGENLTVQGIDHRSFRAGQRYRVGHDVIIELTQPRGPCKALHVYGESLPREVYDKRVKAGDTASPRWGMSGFYAAVIQGGVLFPNAPISLLSQDV